MVSRAVREARRPAGAQDGQSCGAERVTSPSATSWMCTPPSRRRFRSATAASEVPATGRETLDAIGDHNDIRDGVRDANAAAIDPDQWWRRSVVPGWQMTTTWVRRNGRAAGLFAATHPSVFARRLGQQYSELHGCPSPDQRTADSRRHPQTYVDMWRANVVNPRRSRRRSVSAASKVTELWASPFRMNSNKRPQSRRRPGGNPKQASNPKQ